MGGTKILIAAVVTTVVMLDCWKNGGYGSRLCGWWQRVVSGGSWDHRSFWFCLFVTAKTFLVWGIIVLH